MLSGATCNAAAIVGTAVFRIVVSRDSMKNATATSHGRKRLLDAPGENSEDSLLILFVWDMDFRCRVCTPSGPVPLPTLTEISAVVLGTVRLRRRPWVQCLQRNPRNVAAHKS